MSNSLKVLHLTDTHIYSNAEKRLLGVDTHSTLKQLVELSLEKEGTPDLILLTGDLSNDETEHSYDRLLELLEPLQAPIYFLPGNHDSSENLFAQFAKHKGKCTVILDRSFVAGSWFVILLDSVIPGKIEGALVDAELERLDRELGVHAHKHALVCVHHNPLPVMADANLDLGLKNADRFFEITDRHSHVKAILWGHVHAEHSSDRKGVMLIASPSTCVQFKPEGDGMVVDPMPPAYRTMTLKSEGAIETRVEWLPTLPAGLQV